MMKNKRWFLLATCFMITIVAWLSFVSYMDSNVKFGPSNVEQFMIKKVEFLSDNSANVTIKNTAGASNPYCIITFIYASVDGKNATLTPFGSPGGALKPGESASFTFSLQSNNNFVSGHEYEFVVHTARGTMAQYAATYNPAL